MWQCFSGLLKRRQNANLYCDMEEKLKKTPLYSLHAGLKARTVPFAGWEMPLYYSSIIAEHDWCREKASLFDTCHMGQLRFRGDPAYLEPAFTRAISEIPAGRAVYTMMLNGRGGIIEDLLAYRLSDEEFAFVVNAGNREKVLGMLTEMAGGKGVEDVSGAFSKIDLQGPESHGALGNVFGISPDLKPFGFTEAVLGGAECILSRTGYTGETGFEIYCPAEKASSVWKNLLSDARVKAAGLGARDILRLEMGYPLHGSDINEQTTPVEARLERFVDYRKGFIGRDALEQQKSSGARRLLTGLKTGSRRAPRPGSVISCGGEEAGRVTSGAYSPSLGCGIGLGYVSAEHASPGTQVSIGTVEAVTSAVPFYVKGAGKASV